MNRRFFGQRIEVTVERDAAGFSLPTSLTVEGRPIAVVEVLSRWHDAGFSALTRRRTWLERRHRTYYRLRGDDGFIYEVYLDRGGKRPNWFLTLQTTSPSASDRSDRPPSEPR